MARSARLTATSSGEEPRGSAPLLRTLEIGSSGGMGWPPAEELRRLIAHDRMSNVLALHDALGMTTLDRRYLRGIRGTWGRLLRRMPFRVAQAVELVRRRKDVDAMLTWGERDAVWVSSLMLLLRRRPAHVSILFWPAKRKKALPLRVVQHGVDRMIIPSPLQRQLAVERFGLPRSKVVSIPWSVDTRFFRPMPCASRQDTICSVGLEMRDYATLLAALHPLDIRCHIAVGAGAASATPNDALAGMPLREGITVGRKSPVELRQLYACSQFVVVPLHPSNSDNGITTCLEAMAMSKAVICTQTAGQTGVLQHGVNSIRVPPHDELALRRAIERLLNDRVLCARLGAAGRRLVVERYDSVQVAQRFAAVFRAAVEQRRSDTGL